MIFLPLNLNLAFGGSKSCWSKFNVVYYGRLGGIFLGHHFLSYLDLCVGRGNYV